MLADKRVGVPQEGVVPLNSRPNPVFFLLMRLKRRRENEV